MLVVNIENLGNRVLMRCSGRIVAGEEVNTLRSLALAHSGRKELVLDLADIATLDGAGLGMLAFLAARTRGTTLRLRVQNPSPRVRELLELTNLDSILEISSSEEFHEICETLRGTCNEEATAVVAH